MLLRKNPLFTALNLAGLVIGMVACLLILKYVRYEQSYDRQTPYASDIWRVFNQTMNGETILTEDANSHSAIAPTLKADVPEVVDFARLYNGGSSEVTVTAAGQPFELSRFFCTDPGFLRMFPQRMLQGHAATCLQNPYTAVLSETTAKRLFGNTDVLGKTLKIPSGMCAGDYMVTAVAADPPENTHLKFDLLTSYATRYAKGHQDGFDSYWDYTYFQLSPGAGTENVRRRLAAINEQYMKKEGIRLDIQPFADIHLHSSLTYEIEPNGSARSVRFLGLVAMFILFIAFINYVNLATALARERAKEVGIRKATGASRGMLARQFLLESLMLSGVAFALSAALLSTALPGFGQLVGRPLDLASQGTDWAFWVITAGFFGLSALIAGLYPAFLLSGFRPAEVLRGCLEARGGMGMRQPLVVLQFVFSIGLIFGVVVVLQQVRFLKNHDLGLQLDLIVALKTIPAEGRDTMATRRVALFKAECERVSSLHGVAASGITPGLGINSISGSSRPLHWVKSPDFVRSTTYFVETDEDFFDLYGAKILSGKIELFPDQTRRFNSIAINRVLLEQLGFPSPESAVGEQIAFENAENGARTTITAVVENFHIESLKTPPKPTMYYCFPPEQLSYLSVKISPDNPQASLDALHRIWQKIYPEQPFRYWFLDEHFAAQYRAETQFGQVFGLFAGLAVFVSCLGLFGLVAHGAVRRRKEIGIRKVLGASVASVTSLLAGDFLKLVVLAFAIAAPVAYFFMQHWLADFAYRIDIQWWMFAAAGLVAVAIAFLTVGFQSIRAALANPVKSLRRE